jgi:hypothetical protein
MPIPHWRKSWEKQRPKQLACRCTGKKLLHQYLPGLALVQTFSPAVIFDR